MAILKEGIAARLVVPEGKAEIIAMDDSLPGFGIRKFASGKAAYFVKFQIGGQQRKITLGNALTPGMLAETRRTAAKILADARLGVDARKEIETRKARANAPKPVTIGDLLPRYIEQRVQDLRASSFDADRRYLLRFRDAIGAKAPGEVTRADIAAVLDLVQHRRGGDKKVSADRARAAISTFFVHLIERGYVDANPAANIRRRAAGGSRDRVLSPQELKAVWRALPDGDYGRILKLLILTGQRRDEIGALCWTELHDLEMPDRARIELPGARCKNGRAHTVPLSGEAVALLNTIPRREGRDPIFGKGKGGFGGWSKCKTALNARLPKAMPRWTVHDLRRSFSTHCAELDLAPPHVIEQVLNHHSGGRAGVAGAYNKARLTEQTRRLLEIWGTRIGMLLNDQDWTAQPTP